MILKIRLRRIFPKEKGHGYAVVGRQRTTTELIYYDPAWPSLYYAPTIQDAIARHVADRRWKNGDMFLVFKMGQKPPPVIKVVAMFECMDGSLTPRTITDYPDDVKTIIARLREEG